MVVIKSFFNIQEQFLRNFVSHLTNSRLKFEYKNYRHILFEKMMFFSIVLHREACLYILIEFLLQLSMNIGPKILLVFALIFAAQAAVTVNQITGVTNDNLVFSGTIPVSDSANLFFTYFGVDGQKDQASLKNYPLLIVVGNPGTSAQYYALGGIGPVKLNPDMSLSANPHRFTATANLMFIDLIGSGFSFASDPNALPSNAKGFGSTLSLAINTFAKESVLGQSSKVILAGQSTFVRSLPGIDEIGNLKGIIHLAIWPELYAMGRYYGIAGVQLKIFGSSQQIAIDSTFTSCYNNLRSQKFLEAHQCLDTILNFVESKTKNINLFDVRLQTNITEFLPMIQYYFSQPSVVAAWKAPNNRLFESQSGQISNRTFVDLAKNYTKDLSTFMKDFYSVKHWFVNGQKDYISYYKAARNWIQNQLSFVESDAFRKAKLDDIVIDGKVVGYGKAVKQVAYSEILTSGHHLLHDQTATLYNLFADWVGSFTEQEDKNIRTE